VAYVLLSLTHKENKLLLKSDSAQNNVTSNSNIICINEQIKN